MNTQRLTHTSFPSRSAARPLTFFLRYYLAAAKTLQRHKMYYGKMEFLPATHSGHAKDGVRCWSGCKICEMSRRYCAEKGWAEGNEEEDGLWKSCSAKFHSIMSCMLTSRTRLKPEGDLPYTHLADGTTELLVFSECSRRELVKLGLGKQGILGSKIVTPYRVRAFRFIPLNEKMEDLLTPIGGAAKLEDGSGDGCDDVESAKKAEEEEGAPKENGAVGDLGGGVVVPLASNELSAPSSSKGGAGDEPAMTCPEAASPAPPMTSSSSFTGDSSLPTSQRPNCLSTASTTTKKDVSSWTSDGEMDFTQKAITVFVHCQLLTIFGHGVEKPLSNDK